MATGTNLFTSHEARILAHTPNNTTTFLRGDNSWSNILETSLNITKDNECGIEVNNTQTTNPHAGLFGVGSSGDLGIYDRTYSKWIVYSDSSGNVSLNGNASTATALTSDAGGTEQPIYFTGGIPAATSYALKATVNNGNTPYVAYYSGDREISSAKSTNSMIMPSHYYHNLYSDNPTTGTTVYVHYYNGSTTSTNTTANLRVKSGSSFKVLSFSGDGNCSWQGHFTASGGYLNSTANSNTVTIGSQNSGCCHIYNSANIPFAFNRGFLMVNSGDIGSSTYPTGNIIVKSGGRINGNGGALYLGNSNNANWVLIADCCAQAGNAYWKIYSGSGEATFKKVYNAVWNDYAECREVETEEPGYCVTETKSGKMIKTTKRLQAGCKIISDTFGTCMGETETAKTPIAVAGRVLVYPYRAREEYTLGAAVCSAPDGTVDIMSRDEIMMYPERIVGTVSEIPTYDIWNGGISKDPDPISVNGRIWIYVR